MKIEVAVPDEQADLVLQFIAQASGNGIVIESKVVVSSIDDAVVVRADGDGDAAPVTHEPHAAHPDPATAHGAQLAAAIPPLVDALVAARSGQVYRDITTLVLRAVLRRALVISGGNQLRAARLLGINRNTFRKHCDELDLTAGRSGVAPRPSRAPRLRRVSSATAT